MKTLIKNILLLVVTFIAVGCFFTSCDNDDDNKDDGAVPVVRYVRTTSAASSDSIITKAFLGSTIAIIGDNLANVKEIWFNEHVTKLNPVFVTDNSILVIIPNEIPYQINDKMRLITRSGKEGTFDFKVDVPKPAVKSIACEYAEIGSTTFVLGNYFLPAEGSELPVVTFTPNIQAEVESYTQTEIKVKVPQGAKEGPISVSSRYGTTTSTLYYHDTRGMILDWDNLNAAGGWRAGKLSDTDPVGISGKYVRFQGDMAAEPGGTWDEDKFAFNLWGVANGRPEGNLFSTDPSTSVIKFEVNVLTPWSSGALQMIFTPWSLSGTNNYVADKSLARGLWIPWAKTGSFITDGWITVTVPLKDFKYAADGSAPTSLLPENGYGGLTFFVFNGGIEGKECKPHILIDNIRVVPE